MIMCLKQLQEVVNCSMWGAASMICSGAMGEVGGMMVRRAVSSITSRFEMQERHDETMNNLEQVVIKFQCAIETARGRRLTNNNQKLLEWLARIIYAAYLGEYYLRTFQSQTSHPPMIASAQGMSNLLCNYPTNRATKRPRTMRNFLFRNDEYKEVHQVLEMLRSIDIFSFLLMVNAQPERPMKRHLYMEPTRLINRDKEREEVMNFLFEPNKHGENNVDILPIVGSNGVGKTTLAQDCFCDPKVQNHFPLKIYLRWSPLFYPDHDESYRGGPPWIFGDILNQLNCTAKINFDENTLLVMLKQNLSSEKFLIVMDGVSSELDSRVWNALLGCLRCGKEGSKIIFISDLIVYEKIENHKTVKPIMLHGFLEDEYMLFFMDHALGGADQEGFPDLAKLGGEIAKNLDGSIWGAKIIGELLRDNLNVPFWSIFLRVGFLSSRFHGNKDLWPVMQTMCELLPKRLCLTGMIRGPEPWAFAEYNRVKSFRELMVRGPKYCTPVTKQGKNDELTFFVTKHFDLHRSIACYAVCKEAPIGGFDDQ